MAYILINCRLVKGTFYSSVSVDLYLHTFPQVHSLKNICGDHAIRLCTLEKLRDLLHLLKGHLSFCYFLNGLLATRIQTVDKSAENL